jgi:hypothetical protein
MGGGFARSKKDMTTTKSEKDMTSKLELEVSAGEEKQELTSMVGPESNSLDLAETKEPTDVAEEDTPAKGEVVA